MDSFLSIVQALTKAGVRFAVIGVWGVNHYAVSGATLFNTEDRDLFLPPDADNLLKAWRICEEQGFALWAGREPLDKPRDELLARRIVELRAVTSAIDGSGLHVDLSLVMGAFDFDDIWPRRRTFVVNGVNVPVASLTDIVTSKAQANRDKDRLFLATHKEALEHMRRSHQSPPGPPQ